jgi:hypothetical protein
MSAFTDMTPYVELAELLGDAGLARRWDPQAI